MDIKIYLLGRLYVASPYLDFNADAAQYHSPQDMTNLSSDNIVFECRFSSSAQDPCPRCVRRRVGYDEHIYYNEFYKGAGIRDKARARALPGFIWLLIFEHNLNPFLPNNGAMGPGEWTTVVNGTGGGR